MYKPIIAVTEMDKPIDELVRKSDHKILGTWAADCVERVLPYFETKYPKDKRPRQAIEALREWVKTGIFRMADVRRIALASHAAAREVIHDDVARAVARAAGQAMATAHVSTHSIAAGMYVISAIRGASKPTDAKAAMNKERAWQYQHLKDLTK